MLIYYKDREGKTMTTYKVTPEIESGYKGCGAAVALINAETDKLIAFRYITVSKSRSTPEDLAAIQSACDELDALSTCDDDIIRGGDLSSYEFNCSYSKSERKALGITHPWF